MSARHHHQHCRKRKRGIMASSAVLAAAAAIASRAAAFQAFQTSGGRSAAAAARSLSTTAAAAAWLASPMDGGGRTTRARTAFVRMSTTDAPSPRLSATRDGEGQRAPAPAPASPLPPPPTFVNDTVTINNAGGRAIESSDVEAAVGDGAESLVLAIDPRTIEFVPTPNVDATDRLDLLRRTAQPDNETASYVKAAAELEEANGVAASVKDGVRSEVEKQLAKTKEREFDFVKMFRGSAPYIANHRGTIAVYHIPGELLEWDGFSDLMDDISLTWLLGMKIVIVAGCRHQIDVRLDEAHLPQSPVRHNSIRVTDLGTLRLVKEEAGYVRFEVERQLARSLRVHAGPRSAAGGGLHDGNVVSGNFYSAQPFGVIDGVDYMYTGFPRRVEVEKIRQVHSANDIVLLTSLGVSPSGEIFNVNSESLAANVAGSLGASKVIYFTVRGTAMVKKDSDKIVQNLRLTDARNLLEHYRVKIHKRGFASVDDRGIEGGVQEEECDPDDTDCNDARDAYNRSRSSPAVIETLLKVGWAMSALEKGVKRAHIIAPTNGALLQELYTRDGSGTLISRDLYEGIRPADVDDVSGIYDLVDPLVKMGTLVPRPLNVMEKDINSYYVYTRDNLIVACGQLKRFEGEYAEIGCLVVSRDYRSQGRGDAMLGYLERLCFQCGASKVFVLSTQTMEWFVERGFKEVGVDELPPSRRAVYNHNRRSKIYMKHIDTDRDLDAAELWWNR